MEGEFIIIFLFLKSYLKEMTKELFSMMIMMLSSLSAFHPLPLAVHALNKKKKKKGKRKMLCLAFCDWNSCLSGPGWYPNENPTAFFFFLMPFRQIPLYFYLGPFPRIALPPRPHFNHLDIFSKEAKDFLVPATWYFEFSVWSFNPVCGCFCGLWVSWGCRHCPDLQQLLGQLSWKLRI